MRNADLFARQEQLMRKILAETAGYGNVIYEVCNEPGGKGPGFEENPTMEEVNGWVAHFIRLIRETEKNLPYRHLISGQGAFEYGTYIQNTDHAFRNMDLEIVNLHPLSDCIIHDKIYDLGPFMAKHLKLAEFREFCVQALLYEKAFNMDEDNSASRYMDRDGWIIHRKRAWTALVNGVHYDYIDFAINRYMEKGTPEDQKTNRTWFGHLSGFLHSFDLATLRPIAEPVNSMPQHTVVSGAGSEDEICLYLADTRELSNSGAGTVIEGEVVIDLPEVTFLLKYYSPETGRYDSEGVVHGGRGVKIAIPPFRHDIAIRLTKVV
jgi:hypothetical protein